VSSKDIKEADKKEDKKVPAEEVGKKEDVVEEAGKSEALAVVPDQYIPTGKIDPFVPLYNEEQVVAAAKPTKRRRGHLTPLEKVDLSQLTLLGVILAPSGNRAMVAEAGGKGYVVTIGTYMGISSGRVIEILKDRIIVEEEVENILGKISLRKRELKLQKPAGE
jgi:type IV pilus assembly protein PilP